MRQCVWLAEYREAKSDLAEALEFLRTVHADELGYDGDSVQSVRQIVGTLRASRPHLYASTSAVFSYNATPPHNRSVSVPVFGDVRPPGNESDGPADGSAAAAEPRRRARSVVSRSNEDAAEALAAVGRRSSDRRRHHTIEADETRKERQLSSSSSSAAAATRRSSLRDNEITGSDVQHVVADKTIVITRNNERDDTTTGRDYDDDDDDDYEHGKLAVADVERITTSAVTGPVVRARNNSAVVDKSSDVINATLNVTSLPPAPDQKYVDTVFKIAHIFHHVGIGILAFFVLQVAIITCKENI